jgi:hypothetical protein
MTQLEYHNDFENTFIRTLKASHLRNAITL